MSFESTCQVGIIHIKSLLLFLEQLLKRVRKKKSGLSGIRTKDLSNGTAQSTSTPIN